MADRPPSIAKLSGIDEADRLVGQGQFGPAIAVLQPLADAGDARAAAALGNIYADAKYPGADPARARAFYERAAAGGVAAAQHNLAWLLVDDGELEAALAWWEKSSAAGVAESALALYGYHRRHTTMARAIPYLEHAAALGNPFARNTLAHKQMRGEYGLMAIPSGLLLWLRNMPRLAGYIRRNKAELGLK